MIASNYDNNDECVDFNEFRSLMDRDITTLTNRGRSRRLEIGHVI